MRDELRVTQSFLATASWKYEVLLNRIERTAMGLRNQRLKLGYFHLKCLWISK